MTGPNTTVTATADIDGIFKLMKDAFTSSSKVLLELMQNARRAGSPTVEIEYDEAARVMSVIDDGTGIDDFGTLLMLARSGWDKQTATLESAFGAGFWSAVFGCERLQVESKGRGFLADTADILAFKPVDIYACEQKRTVVRMIGVRKPIPLAPAFGGQGDFERAAAGFPLPVLLNGATLPRPNALGDGFVKTPIGHIRLGGSPLASARIFLQGFCVETVAPCTWGSRDAPETIVHLDSTLFRARAPDRDCLIDAADAVKTIDAAIRALWVEHYQALKGRGDSDALIRDAQLVIRLGCAHLLNDIPVLPGCVLDDVGIDRFFAGDHDPDWRHAPENLTREQAAGLTLVSASAIAPLSDYSCLEGFSYDDFDAELIEDFNLTMYLELHKVVVIRDGMLDSRHWVFGLPNCIRKRLAAPTVSLTDGIAAVEVRGQCISAEFVPCASITFTGELGEVSSDRALALIPDDEAGAAPRIAVAAKASERAVCKMLSAYTDGNDHFIEDWLDEDVATLENELTVARTGNVTLLIEQALSSVMHSTAAPRLEGRTFTVTVLKQDNGRRLVVKEREVRPAQVKRSAPKRKRASA